MGIKRKKLEMATLGLKTLPVFGAEIIGDLSRPLDDEAAKLIRRAFSEHRLLVARGQSLTREQQEALVGLFGPISPPDQDVPIVSNFGDPGMLGSAELAFHSDMAYAEDPYDCISLHALSVKDGATSTKFVDGVMLYERLPGRIRAWVDTVRIRNVYGMDYSRRLAGAVDPRLPQNIFPLVVTHPSSGVRFLRFSFIDTYQIIDLSPEESEEKLKELFAFAYSPDNIQEHFWYRGDLVIWDNRALQHARVATGDAERTLQRVSSIKRTLSEQFPQYPNGWADVAAIYSEQEEDWLKAQNRSESRQH